jgi:hypothetical protein
MPSSRRNFLQGSASAAALVTFGRVEPGTPLRHPEPADPAVKAFERRLLKARPLPLDQIRVTGGPLRNAQDLTDCRLPARRYRAPADKPARRWESV